MEPVLRVDDALVPILEQLAAREPIFHRREFVHDRESFERETAEDFWEVAASGRRFSREFVWAGLRTRYQSGEPDEYETARWETRDFHLRQVGPETYLITYTLWGQGDRLTRRLTVWQGNAHDGWKILFHQGTVANPS